MLQLNDIHFHYSASPTSASNNSGVDTPTLMHFELAIKKGEKVAIIGASGAGKSTLLNLIAGFLFADSGEIWLDGDNHSNSKPHQRPISILFQAHNLFNHLSVADNIGLGIQPNLKLSKAEQQQVINIAHQVGLAEMLDKKPNQLSGGQQQRVALARCLLRDKPILLLDEPFSALDKDLREEMLVLLNQLCEDKQLTLIIVTHQLEEIQPLVDRVIEIKGGKIHEQIHK